MFAVILQEAPGSILGRLCAKDVLFFFSSLIKRIEPSLFLVSFLSIDGEARIPSADSAYVAFNGRIKKDSLLSKC